MSLWTEKDIKKLMSLRNAGYGPTEIAKRMGISMSRVKNKLCNMEGLRIK